MTFSSKKPDPSEFLNLEEGRLGGVHAGGSRRDEPVDNGGSWDSMTSVVFLDSETSSAEWSLKSSPGDCPALAADWRVCFARHSRMSSKVQFLMVQT